MVSITLVLKCEGLNFLVKSLGMYAGMSIVDYVDYPKN